MTALPCGKTFVIAEEWRPVDTEKFIQAVKIFIDGFESDRYEYSFSGDYTKIRKFEKKFVSLYPERKKSKH